ncbi:carboxymuconolactone decarboxylase family protein [Pseudonocardia dioxanivorans]|jgi:alkylhydroperoxidase family enzyme|uniref:carboxymuconolactone decarboxylase family protein n=1 Tax=Pseudonocardia dioxanivorans TaxID=240495 RepID=UPI000CD03B20|nr:carboxymuconolactone decarboxylase family protein [Pseudonocardia dioxanivorans]
MALVPYLSESDLAESDRELLERPINLFRGLANSPDGLRHFHVLGQWIRHGCELDPRLRELAILQVGYLTASPYEWSHHVKIGHDFGVTDADIADLVKASNDESHGLGDLETLVLTAAREITADRRVSDETWASLEKALGRARAVDLVIIASFYNAVIRILGTLRIDVEPEYAGYLEQFPLPETPLA